MAQLCDCDTRGRTVTQHVSHQLQHLWFENTRALQWFADLFELHPCCDWFDILCAKSVEGTVSEADIVAYETAARSVNIPDDQLEAMTAHLRFQLK